MIDEKTLSELQRGLTGMNAGEFKEKMDEVFRLARLGLWAENHGIPALVSYADPANWKDRHGKGGGVDDTFLPEDDLGGFTHGKFARAAIIALPADSQALVGGFYETR